MFMSTEHIISVASSQTETEKACLMSLFGAAAVVGRMGDLSGVKSAT